MEKDWREDYVICQHVADNENLGVRHRGFRVCCDECFNRGFLTVDELDIYESSTNLTIGHLK